jgi:hypothetical protein
MGSYYAVACLDCEQVLMLVPEDEYNQRKGETALTDEEGQRVQQFLREHGGHELDAGIYDTVNALGKVS